MKMTNIVVNPSDDELRYVGIKAQISHHIINEISQRLKEDNYKLSSEGEVPGLQEAESINHNWRVYTSKTLQCNKTLGIVVLANLLAVIRRQV